MTVKKCPAPVTPEQTTSPAEESPDSLPDTMAPNLSQAEEIKPPPPEEAPEQVPVAVEQEPAAGVSNDGTG